MDRGLSGFKPSDLLPDASLNRTAIPDAEPFPREYRGARGFDVLGSGALGAVPSTRAGVTEAARRLAALLAALARGTDSRDGRGLDPTPWRLQYLGYWSQVEEVWIAGGSAQRFGADLGPATTAALADYGVEIEVACHSHPALLPLIGTARTTPGDHQAAAVLDFGNSWIKRGVARFDAFGALCSLDVLRPLRVDPAAAAADEVIAFLDKAVRMTLAYSSTATTVACAVAAYVTPHGVVSDPRSYYAPIGGLTASPLGARFVHDGTAAASGIDTTRRAAVITLGTALGVGFVTDTPRRPIAGRFTTRG